MPRACKGCLLLLVSFFAVVEAIFLAPQFTSKAPFTYDIDQREVNYELKICDSYSLNLCNFTVEVVLPYDSWSLSDGTYVNISVVGSADRCKHVLCKNDPSLPNNPNYCTFTYTEKMGDRLYVLTKGGPSAVFSSVMTANFSCSVDTVISNDLPFGKSYEECDINAQSTRIITETETPLHVRTSKYTYDSLQIQLSSCFTIDPNTTVLTIVGTDNQSAFATYLCEIYPCSTAIAFAYDNSGTGYNYVKSPRPFLQRLTVAVYGWGAYKGINSFLLQFVQGLDTHDNNFLERAKQYRRRLHKD